MTRLTKNFTLDELTASKTANRLGIKNRPSGRELQNLQELAERLQRMRDALGAPLIITSGFRNKALNTAVGGARWSQHLLGRAADISIKGHDCKEMVQAALKAGFSGIGLGRAFLHVDTRPQDHVTVWEYNRGATQIWKPALGLNPAQAVRDMARAQARASWS